MQVLSSSLKRILVLLNKELRLGLHGKDADTSSVHQMPKFHESLSWLPLTLPRMYVCGNQEICGAICCESAFDRFPHPAVTLKETSHAYTFFIHKHLS